MSRYYAIAGDRLHQRVVHPDNSPLHYLTVDHLRLPEGMQWRGNTGDREMVVVPFAGEGMVRADYHERPWEGGITRDDVFTSAPSFVYLPAGTVYSVVAAAGLEAVLISAPALGVRTPERIAAEAVAVTDVGADTWRRQVRILCGPDASPTRLVVGETVSPPGHWSGIPPHKHDEATPEESVLEEVYVFRMAPPEGFGIQYFYDRRGWSASVPIAGEGAVAILRGYHPTVAAPGTALFYLWALAGPVKQYRVSLDPAFSWARRPAVGGRGESPPARSA